MIRDFLVSRTAWDWTCIFTAWLLLAAVAGVSIGRCIKRADMAELRQRADITRKAAYPPPPPAPRPRLADDLLADVPVSVDKWLTPELSDRLFDDLIAMEGLQ